MAAVKFARLVFDYTKVPFAQELVIVDTLEFAQNMKNGVGPIYEISAEYDPRVVWDKMPPRSGRAR